MRDLLFAIDCDEVLRPVLPAMVELYNDTFDQHMTVSDVTSFKVDDCFTEIKKQTGIGGSEWFFQMHSDEVFEKPLVISGVKEALEKLSEIGRIIIVTYQKTSENKCQVINWLEKNGIKYDGIFIVKDKTLLPCDYLVDDNDWNMIGTHAKHCALITEAYNKDADFQKIMDSSSTCEDVVRYSSLKEFADDVYNKYKSGSNI